VTGEFPVAKGYWLYDIMQQVSREKYYFCISQCTKRDFLKYCHKADPEKVRVVYNGYTASAKAPEREQTEQIIKAAGLVQKRYILILGNVVPHKNVNRQLRAGVRFIRQRGLSDFQIAVVGSCNDPEEILQSAKIAREDRSLIVFCGYVPDAHIRAYYGGAFCLSFTSLYEGFGLPALEAMQDGCPVVTSNTSALPEVVGDAALCIPPADEEAHIEAYTRLWKDEKLREELIRRGKERVKQFTWERTAKQMMDGMKNDRTV
jgi:glycosyltransferase involved in cell wall biosynthesis